MKNRVRLCSLFIILTILCFGCDFFGYQKYVCEIDKVKSIQIVRLEEHVQEEYRFEYTVLATIFDCSTFVDRLNRIKHSVNWEAPGTFEVGCVVIKIEYLDDDYDLLYTSAQMFNRSGENQYGYFLFNQEQFDALISDYFLE